MNRSIIFIMPFFVVSCTNAANYDKLVAETMPQQIAQNVLAKAVSREWVSSPWLSTKGFGRHVAAFHELEVFRWKPLDGNFIVVTTRGPGGGNSLVPACKIKIDNIQGEHSAVSALVSLGSSISDGKTFEFGRAAPIGTCGM